MGKTFRRDSSFRPKGGKDLKKFKKSNKFKKWNEKPHRHQHEDPIKDVELDENLND